MRSQGRGRGSDRGGGRVPLPGRDKLVRIIQSNAPEDAQLLVEWAEKLGASLQAKGLTTGQIRNVFGTVRQIEAQWREGDSRAARKLILLKPKLSYQAARQRGKGGEELAEVLGQAIDLVENKADNFGRFVDFFEAILAYHKAAGGK